MIIAIATAPRLYLDSAAGLIASAVVAGIGIALIQAALANPAINPHAENTGYFANPAGPDGEGCVVAYVEATANPDANDLARRIADENASIV